MYLSKKTRILMLLNTDLIKGVGRFCVSLSAQKKSAKNNAFFASDESFCQLFFFTDEILCRQLVFTDECSFYRHRGKLVFSNLKIPLVYLFDFRFD